MFCPKCKYEYIEGITKCSTCGAALVEKLPPEEKYYVKLEYVELVTAFYARGFVILAIAKSILDGAGIRYFAKGEHLIGCTNVTFNSIPGIQIQVSKDDVEIARELLKDLS